MVLIKCPECGTQMSDTFKYCPKCGAKISDMFMYCSECGTKISDNARYCPKCGMPTNAVSDNQGQKMINKNQNTNKKSNKGLWIGIGVGLIALIIVLVVILPRENTNSMASDSSTSNTPVSNTPSYRNVPGYVDLGLPSGTLWKKNNEMGDFYTYDEAYVYFVNELPTKEQFEELINYCKWTWTGCGYELVGPSGKSMILPAAGGRFLWNGEVMGVGVSGHYWTATSYQRDGAWYLSFNSKGFKIENISRGYGHSVRLVLD